MRGQAIQHEQFPLNAPYSLVVAAGLQLYFPGLFCHHFDPCIGDSPLVCLLGTHFW